MSYEEALTAGGAEVLAFEQFGSYQGDWWAKVSATTANLDGRKGAMEAVAVAMPLRPNSVMRTATAKNTATTTKTACPACNEAKQKYAERLADFGRTYLEGLLSQERAEEEAARNIEWDSDAVTMLAWIKANAEA